MADTTISTVKVFSYRRFSSGRQASGHSLERQTESARRWCKEHGHQLDEGLALADLGVSAYSGDNVSRGALAGFLAAAESGRIPVVVSSTRPIYLVSLYRTMVAHCFHRLVLRR